MFRLHDYNLKCELMHFLKDTREYITNSYNVDKESVEIQKVINTLLDSRKNIYEIYKLLNPDVTEMGEFLVAYTPFEQQATPTVDDVYLSTIDVLVLQIRKELITVVNVMDIIHDAVYSAVNKQFAKYEHQVIPSKRHIMLEAVKARRINHKEQGDHLRELKRYIVDPNVSIVNIVDKVTSVMAIIGMAYFVQNKSMDILGK